MQYVWMAMVGFMVGLVARALPPSDQKRRLELTAALGVAGSCATGLVGQALGWYGAGQGAGFIGSVVGALLLPFLVSKLKGGSSSSTDLGT